MAKKAKLGSGARFKSLEKSIASRGGVSNPAAVAASIGRAKYGAKRFAKLSAKGRRGK
jgi:hypothetical protein